MNAWAHDQPAAGVPELTESGTTPTYYGERTPSARADRRRSHRPADVLDDRRLERIG